MWQRSAVKSRKAANGIIKTDASLGKALSGRDSLDTELVDVEPCHLAKVEATRIESRKRVDVADDRSIEFNKFRGVDIINQR